MFCLMTILYYGLAKNFNKNEEGKMSNIAFKVVPYGKDEHEAAIALRKEVLYEARGISPPDYNEQEDHVQICGFIDDTLIATCSLVSEGDSCRMRYVAIKGNIQGSGIGSKMLLFFEDQAKAQGFQSVYCHARDTAINFYAKNGYKTEGEVFEQVTIPHIKMRKVLMIKRYILTGTPGSGKTSIIEALAASGYSTIAEAATDVINQEQQLGKELPWESPAFIDSIIDLQRKRQIQANNDLLFFDRSPICTYALSQYLGFAPSALLDEEIERIKANHIYETKVFFIDNLGFIENTDARMISFEESLKFEKIHLDVYQRFGYDLVRIQKGDIQARTQKIIREII